MPASGMPATGDMEAAGGSTAADALDTRGDDTMGEGMHDETAEAPSATLDMELMGHNKGKFQVGDEIVFKITNIDPEANTFSVEYATGEGGGEDEVEPWKKDLRDTMASEPTPPSTGPDQKVYKGGY